MTEKIRSQIARITPAHLQEQHACNWPTCPKRVPVDMWGCRDHWFRLPPEIRRRIWKEYDPNDRLSPVYLAAFNEAQEWIKQNHPELFEQPVIGNEYHSKGAPLDD